LTIRLRGVQFRHLIYSLKLAFSRHDDKAKGDISHFQSLMTALAATIGIGSITGIATGIAIGGVGSIFWMWLVALFCMAIKYAEGILALLYRSVDVKKEMCGGPMYYLEKGMKSKFLGIAFAVIGAIAAFGTGNVVQANSIADAVNNICTIDPYIIGIVLAVLIGITLFGGIKTIGKVSSYLVPTMGIFYLIGGVIVIATKYYDIPYALYQIFSSAFTGQAATGGFVGATIIVAMQTGVSRGIFSSEAGLGTAPIAAAAAKTDVPGRQALISMSGVFLTSFVVCTITGLVITLTGVIGQVDVNAKVLNGSGMAIAAFDQVLPFGGTFVMIAIILFGYSTILGWSYYGEKCVEYLFGIRLVGLYRCVFTMLLVPGAFLSLKLVWSFANIMNGLMAIPNLIGLIFMAKIVAKETRSFEKLIKKETLKLNKNR
jgi:alanine or glycine:cation symporter, AGCS family